MKPTVTPTLITTDWNEEWKALQAARNRPDDAGAWDARARTFGNRRGHSAYSEEFQAKAALRPDESALDMGCGNGALALPLAAAGHEVVAADFSAGMLEALRQDATAEELTRIRLVQMSWDDDWAARGVGPDSVDVALASRSIVTADLKASLTKLSAVARRRCCLTMPTGPSPRIDPTLLDELGLTASTPTLYLYAVMILAALGYFPELSYIVNRRDDRFVSPEEAEEVLGRMVRDALGGDAEREWPEAQARLKAWLADNLVRDEGRKTDGRPEDSDRPQKPWKLVRPRQIRWAFIAWNTS